MKGRMSAIRKVVLPLLELTAIPTSCSLRIEKLDGVLSRCVVLLTLHGRGTVVEMQLKPLLDVSCHQGRSRARGGKDVSSVQGFLLFINMNTMRVEIYHGTPRPREELAYFCLPGTRNYFSGLD